MSLARLQRPGFLASLTNPSGFYRRTFFTSWFSKKDEKQDSNDDKSAKKPEKPRRKTDEELDEEIRRRPRRYVPMDPHEQLGFERAWNVLKWDLRETWDIMRGKREDFGHREAQIFPQFADICIIGGGLMGSLIAYYIKQRVPGDKTLRIVIVERDPTYLNAQSINSLGAMRVQFSQEINVKAALFGAEFIRKMKEHLSYYDVEAKDCEFNPQGFLFLGTEADVAQMQINHETQINCGAKVALLDSKQLSYRYPWLNTEGIALASYGLDHEGWFDPWKLLHALKAKNMSLGIYYIEGEAQEFLHDDNMQGHHIRSVGGNYFDRLKFVKVKTRNYGVQKIQSAFWINAAGANSCEVAKMAGIGNLPGARCIPLPVERRKRYLFAFHCPEGPKLSMPILVCPNGIVVRRDGLNGMYICQWIPKTNEEEPKTIESTYIPDQFFNEVVWPKLAYRIPVFQKLQLRGGWSVFYDYNYFDQSGIVGPHIYHGNYLFATGFSGYGINMAPAIGNALMDYIYEAEYGEKLNMNSLEFMRFMNFESMKEIVIL